MRTASPTVDLFGTISNTTSGLIFASGNGVVDLEDGAAISGGTLKTSGSQAAILVDDGDAATISGATIASGSFVLAATDGATLTLSNGTAYWQGRDGRSVGRHGDCEWPHRRFWNAGRERRRRGGLVSSGGAVSPWQQRRGCGRQRRPGHYQLLGYRKRYVPVRDGEWNARNYAQLRLAA